MAKDSGRKDLEKKITDQLKTLNKEMAVLKGYLDSYGQMGGASSGAPAIVAAINELKILGDGDDPIEFGVILALLLAAMKPMGDGDDPIEFSVILAIILAALKPLGDGDDPIERLVNLLALLTAARVATAKKPKKGRKGRKSK